MDSSPRERLVAYICASPGATFRELLRGTNMTDGPGRHHINVLLNQGVIVERPHKQTLRYFEKQSHCDAAWQAVVMLREPELNLIHDWLLANPGAVQKDILAWAADSLGWSRSTAQHRIGRLVQEGVVVIRPRGRFKRHFSGLDAALPPSATAPSVRQMADPRRQAVPESRSRAVHAKAAPSLDSR